MLYIITEINYNMQEKLKSDQRVIISEKVKIQPTSAISELCNQYVKTLWIAHFPM